MHMDLLKAFLPNLLRTFNAVSRNGDDAEEFLFMRAQFALELIGATFAS